MSSIIETIPGNVYHYTGSTPRDEIASKKKEKSDENRIYENNPKLKIKGTVKSWGSGTVRSGKYENISFAERIKKVINPLHNKKILVMNKCNVIYTPYITEMSKENLTCHIKLKTSEKTYHNMFSFFSRASDEINIELDTEILIVHPSYFESSDIIIEYTSGSQITHDNVGKIEATLTGYLADPHSLSCVPTLTEIAEIWVNTRGYGLDVSAYKMYYVSGVSKVQVSKDIGKVDVIRSHLRFNGVSLDDAEVFDILSSLPLQFSSVISQINHENWATDNGNQEFMLYVKSCKASIEKQSIGYKSLYKFVNDGKKSKVTYVGVPGFLQGEGSTS